jgi:hypothetical protein
MLPLLGRLVLGVLAEITMLAGPEDLLGQLNAQLALDCCQSVLQTLAHVHHFSGCSCVGRSQNLF